MLAGVRAQLFSQFEDLQISQAGIVSPRSSDEVDEFTHRCHVDGYEVKDKFNTVVGYVVQAPNEGFFFCRADSDIAGKLLERKKEEDRLTEALEELRKLPNLYIP